MNLDELPPEFQAALDDRLARESLDVHEEALLPWLSALANKKCRGKNAALRDGGTHLTAAMRALYTILIYDEIDDLAVLSATWCFGDAHALDRKSDARKLVVSALAFIDEKPFPESELDVRELFLRHRVVVDPVSSNVLCANLLPVGDYPLAKAMRILAGSDIVLTYSQLRQERLRFNPGIHVLIVENPSVAFHLARTGPCPPLVCTSGNPRLAVAALLQMLVDSDACLHHQCDFDFGGLGIADMLASRFQSVPWRYDRDTFDTFQAFHHGTPSDKMTPMREPHADLSRAIIESGKVIHQEAIVKDLADDLYHEWSQYPGYEEAQSARREAGHPSEWTTEPSYEERAFPLPPDARTHDATGEPYE